MPALAVASIFVVAGSAVALAAPRVAGMAVDSALGEGSPGRLDAIAVILVTLFAVRGAMSFAEQYLLRATGGRMLRALRQRTHSHLLTLGPGFYQDRPVGELLSRLGSDLERIQGTLTQRGPTGARAGLTFVGAVAILFTLHAQLAWVALCMVPVVVALSYLYGRRLQSLATRTQDQRAKVSAAAEESLSGVRTVQSFGAEDDERARYGDHLDRLLGVQIESARTVGLFSGLLQFVGFSAFALVVWYGGRLIADGDGLTPGELTSSLIYTFAIASSIGPLGTLYAGLRELRGASARVFQLLDEEPAMSDAPGAAPLPESANELRIDDAWFQYPGADDFALRGVSLSARRGELVALVGPSGAGKSTLFALIQRFYDPQRGAVRIGGADLRGAALSSVRRSVAVVPQDVFLFSRSIADNIRVGRPEASDSEVRAAARAAGADEFIRELSGGYEAEVGERGVKLSAGQRQRIAIARALLARPAILLLDEATSALDPDSEATIHRALTAAKAEVTTLVIAHRLTTARLADHVVLLDRGAIAAAGTDADLRDTSDLYRHFWTPLSVPGSSYEP